MHDNIRVYVFKFQTCRNLKVQMLNYHINVQALRCRTSHPMMAFLCSDSSCAMMVSVEYPASENNFSRSCRAEHTLAFCAWMAFTASGRMMDRKFMFKSYG